MKNLEERQREMRERTLASNSFDEAVAAPTSWLQFATDFTEHD